jgi:hypothetical protein
MTSVVVPDAADPLRLMTAIRKVLKPGGTYLCGEPNYGEKVEDNVGPRHAVLYGGSIFYCLTTSLANNGLGLDPWAFQTRSPENSPRRQGSVRSGGWTSTRRGASIYSISERSMALFVRSGSDFWFDLTLPLLGLIKAHSVQVLQRLDEGAPV